MSATQALNELLVEVAEAADLKALAACLLRVGKAIGLEAPAVIDDYSKYRVLTVEDGMAFASLLGWPEAAQQAWSDQKLYRFSPIAAVCRVTTRPFVWDAAVVAEAVRATAHPQQVHWPATPEQGIFGGLTVPVHLPGARTGSVSWYARNDDIRPEAVLREHRHALRSIGYCAMDLIYALRMDKADGAAPAPLLTEREVECLSWAALGLTDKEIGERINRSHTTARFHLDNAIGKLGARNRTQAVAVAVHNGLIHPHEE